VPASSYDRSKGVESIRWREFPLGKGIALALLEESTPRGRQLKGQALLDTLNQAAGLPACRLTVADRPQQHRTRAGRLELKTYGYYRVAMDEGRVAKGSIRIYNLTAIRRQVLSPKVFLETLLHEWVHHYDFTGLRLDRSPHTSGFFARIRAVAETLGVGFVAPPKRDLAGAIPLAAVDVVAASTDRLRPGGVAPPKWIRDQIHALFGHRSCP
jgi:hypothetical protein